MKDINLVISKYQPQISKKFSPFSLVQLMYLNTEFGPNTGKDGPEKLIIHKFRILKVSEASDHEDSNLL